MPRDSLLWHHLALFVQGTMQPHIVPPKIHEDFHRWAKPRGIAVSPSTLPFFRWTSISLGSPYPIWLSVQRPFLCLGSV